MPTWLALAHRTGAAAKVQRYISFTAVDLGNAFDTLEAGGLINGISARNRTVQVGNKVYAVQNDGVYRLQGDGVTWSNTLINGGLPFTTQAGGTDLVCRSGLEVIYISDAPHLVGAYRTTTGQMRGFLLDLNTNVWSEGAASVGLLTVPTGASGGFWNQVVFQGQLFIFGSDSTSSLPRCLRYNPSTDQWFADSLAIANLVDRSLDACVFNNRLHATYRTAASAVRLAEWVSGTWIDMAAIDPGPVTGSAVAHRDLLFTDQTNLYAQIGSDSTWRCWQLNGALTATDISTTVLPAALRSAAVGGGTFVGAPDGRLIGNLDIDTLPGTFAFQMYYATGGVPGTAWDLYKWNGNAAFMTLLGSGGDVAHAMPATKAAGGERIYTPGELDILMITKAPVLGGERIFWKCWGDPGPINKTVKFYYNRQGEPATTQATLMGTAAGGSSIRVGNEVQQVEADDGVTTFEVTWNLAADGITPGDLVQLVPRITQ